MSKKSFIKLRIDVKVPVSLCDTESMKNAAEFIDVLREILLEEDHTATLPTNPLGTVIEFKQ